MSAFLCSENHLSTMAKIIYSLSDKYEPSVLFRILLDENLKSVGHRYNETPKEAVKTWTDNKGMTYQADVPLPPYSEWYALISCYDYQSCEHPGYVEGPIGQLMEWLKNHIAENQPDKTKEQLLELGPWGI